MSNRASTKNLQSSPSFTQSSSTLDSLSGPSLSTRRSFSRGRLSSINTIETIDSIDTENSQPNTLLTSYKTRSETPTRTSQSKQSIFKASFPQGLQDSAPNRRSNRSKDTSTSRAIMSNNIDSDASDFENQTGQSKNKLNHNQIQNPLHLPSGTHNSANNSFVQKPIRVVITRDETNGYEEEEEDEDNDEFDEATTLLPSQHTTLNNDVSSTADHHMELEDPTAYKLIQTKGELELTKILSIGLLSASSSPSPSRIFSNTSNTQNDESTCSFGLKSIQKDERIAPELENDAKDMVATSIWTDLRGDYINALVLLLLYILQGLPIGLSQTIPLVMAEKKVGFATQAVFSLASLPFSCKLLWAPFVDTYYSRILGKRKSWIIPTQLLCGGALLWCSSLIDFWITGTPPSGIGGNVLPTVELVEIVKPHVDVTALSYFFIFLYFLMATQDIAVDAWALSMLRSRNVVWAGTINNIGQYVGMYVTNISYLLLSSPTFCTQWLWFLLPTHFNPETGLQEVIPQGLLDITTLMTICGFLFIFTTIIIFTFKTEEETHPYDRLADLFWQLQERKRQTGTLTIPLSISLSTKSTQNNSSIDSLTDSQTSLSQSTKDPSSGPNLRLSRTKSSLNTNTNTTPSPSPTIFDQVYPEHFFINEEQNVTHSIPKKLYPFELANTSDVSQLTALSDQIFTLSHNMVTQSSIVCKANANTTSKCTSHGAGATHDFPPNPSQIELLQVICTERRYLAHTDDGDQDEGLLITLQRMKNVLSLPNVRLLVFWLLTFRISVAACDSITQLKLFAIGLHKEQIAYLSSCTAPLTFIVPIYLTSILTSSKTPFQISILALVPRILVCFCWVTFVAIFPYLLEHGFSATIFGLLLMLTLSEHFVALVQMVSGMSFFALVADPKIAATFITLLHTAANLGSTLARLTSMQLVDLFTVQVCMDPNTHVGEALALKNDPLALKSDTSEATSTSQSNDHITASNINSISQNPTKYLTTINSLDVSSLYNTQLLHNIDILHKSRLSLTDADLSESLFIKSLLTQPQNIQTQTLSQMYNYDISQAEVTLFNIGHRFMSSTRSFLESIHLISPYTSKLFFHEAYLGNNSNFNSEDLITATPHPRITSAPQFKTLLQDYITAANNSGQVDEHFIAVQNIIRSSTDDLLDKEWLSTSELLSHSLTVSPRSTGTTDNSSPITLCDGIGGATSSVVDGYFVEVISCGIFGLIYLSFMWPYLKKLDQLPISAWRSK